MHQFGVYAGFCGPHKHRRAGISDQYPSAEPQPIMFQGAADRADCADYAAGRYARPGSRRNARAGSYASKVNRYG